MYVKFKSQRYPLVSPLTEAGLLFIFQIRSLMKWCQNLGLVKDLNKSSSFCCKSALKFIYTVIMNLSFYFQLFLSWLCLELGAPVYTRWSQDQCSLKIWFSLGDVDSRLQPFTHFYFKVLSFQVSSFYGQFSYQKESYQLVKGNIFEGDKNPRFKVQIFSPLVDTLIIILMTNLIFIV